MRHKFRNFSDCDFPNYCDYAQDMLRKWLEMLCFPIALPLLINGHFEKQNEGKPDEWEYKASFAKDEQGRVFLCGSARFTAIGQLFDVKILIPESEIKKK